MTTGTDLEVIPPASPVEDYAEGNRTIKQKRKPNFTAVEMVMPQNSWRQVELR